MDEAGLVDVSNQVFTTVQVVSQIPGSPLNSSGQLGSQRTLNVSGLNTAGQNVATVTTTPTLIPIGSTGYPAIVTIRSNEVVGSGLTILFSLSSSTGGVIPIELLPGTDILVTLTGALYAYVASGTTANGYWVGAVPAA